MNLTVNEKEMLSAYKEGGLQEALKYRAKSENKQMFEAKLEVLERLENEDPVVLSNYLDAVPLLTKEGRSPKYISQYILRVYFPNIPPTEKQGIMIRINHRIKNPQNAPAQITSETGAALMKSCSVTYKDGITTYADDIEKDALQTESDLLTPEDVMRYKGIDPTKWRVTGFTANSWQGMGKDGGTTDLWQTKLSVAPLKQTEISFSDIDDFMRSKTFSNQPPAIKPFPYNQNKEHLEIDIADLHCGLLSWRNETGSDFDLKICKDRFLEAISDMVKRAEGQPFKDIHFCTLGDILHIDNDENKTTKGTLQQAEGRFSKIFDFAFDMIDEAIRMLLTLGKPIKYIYTCGNHDRNTGYFLVKCLKTRYENNPNIEFDIMPNPTKTISFGKVLVGLSHGDYPKKNKGVWMLNDARKQFGNAEFVEEHCGHIHTEEVAVVNGIIVRHVLAQCGNSYWEHQQGYRSTRGIMAFVWNEDTGLRGTWYYNF